MDAALAIQTTYFSYLRHPAMVVDVIGTKMDLPPLLLPKNAIYQSVAIICLSFISIEIIHQLFRRRAATDNNKSSSEQQQLYNKTSVQLTHIVVNFTLAILGIFTWFGPQGPPRWEDCSLLDRWTGFQQYNVFGNIMISYNVWSSYASRVCYVFHTFCVLWMWRMRLKTNRHTHTHISFFSLHRCILVSENLDDLGS